MTDHVVYKTPGTSSQDIIQLWLTTQLAAPGCTARATRVLSVRGTAGVMTPIRQSY